MCNFRKFNIGNLSSTREPDKRSYRLIPLKDCLILSALWSLHCNLLHFIKKLLSALVSSKISEGLYYILSNSNEVLELDRVDHGSDDAFEFVGLDCEMVGSGRHGKQNMLARCTLVTISDEAVNVIYDNLVLPTRPVTDYRTQYSGMTSDLFVRAPNQISCLGDIPNKKCELVTFSKCQEEVRRLLDSIKGKKVVVVGHGLVNDFEALRISHPLALTRDTAFYPPLMRHGHRRFFSKKLSELAIEELGEYIQKSDTSLGHDSIEDAATALRIYLKHAKTWEQRLGYPLKQHVYRKISMKNDCPGATLYLDGCNLPLSLRISEHNDDTWRLLYKIKSSSRDQKTKAPLHSEIDFLPILENLLKHKISSQTPIQCIRLVYDGSKYVGHRRLPIGGCILLSPGIEVHITQTNDPADDVIIRYCQENSHHPLPSASVVGSKIKIHDVLNILRLDGQATIRGEPSKYVLARRNGTGGGKTHRKIFRKINLTRSSEGFYCFNGFTSAIQKESLRRAMELFLKLRDKVSHFIEFEVRSMEQVKNIVCTDDILLSDRVVQNEGLVLTFGQFFRLNENQLP